MFFCVDGFHDAERLNAQAGDIGEVGQAGTKRRRRLAPVPMRRRRHSSAAAGEWASGAAIKGVSTMLLGLCAGDATRTTRETYSKVVSCRQTVTLFSIAPRTHLHRSPDIDPKTHFIDPRTHLPVGTRAPLPSRGYTQHAERVIGK